ncbi:hypothetical protein N1851_019322 [Merluccius polli]|uniref:Alkylated DNA repair protein AlkB homologue 8 N-terminal domain-containing protein n=1 Tax=Merluccius polli TaxID=89951 RepID=A0AA47MLY3_MERPO|nr:hypothetical protein N1851_019322 [Merluccius polli]
MKILQTSRCSQVSRSTESLCFKQATEPDHYRPLIINNEVVERVTEFKFLGLIVSESLSWSSNTDSVIGKAQQRLYYLRKLKQDGLPQNLLINFYHCAVESVLTYCMSVWFSSCTKAEQEALQRVVKAVGRIIGTTLPSITSVFTSRCLRRSKCIIKDQSHPAHHLFQLLPSGRRYRVNYAFIVYTDAFIEYTDAFIEYTDAFIVYTDAFIEYTDAFIEYTDAFIEYTDAFIEYTDAFIEYTDAFIEYTDAFIE